MGALCSTRATVASNEPSVVHTAVGEGALGQLASQDLRHELGSTPALNVNDISIT